MPYFLAVCSAALYGAADFAGGLTSRRADTIVVVLVSQFAGLLVLALTVPLLPAVSPSGGDLLWGAAAGLAGGVGVALLYRALAIGMMAVVAPTTAVCAVVIPVVVAVLFGEVLSPVTIAGIVLALVAIVLVAQERRGETATDTAAASDDPHLDAPPEPTVAAGELAAGAETTDPVAAETEDLSAEVAADQRRPRRRWVPLGLGYAFLSGIAIAGFYLALSRTNRDAGLWPLLVARCASVSLFLGMAVATGRSVRIGPGAAGLAVVAGVLDILANTLYMVAMWSGPLGIIVTLSSLYPASTVLLARVFLRERLNALQIAGVVGALVAVALIVGGR